MNCCRIVGWRPGRRLPHRRPSSKMGWVDGYEKMKESGNGVGVNFTWEFDGTGTIHARHIVTDHGWKISLDRGLDIFQHYEMNDAFTFANRLQQYRPCKAFEATFIPTEDTLE